MRIDDLNRAPQTQGAEKTDQAALKRGDEKSSTALGSDHAEVSQLAKALATTNPERLEQLRLEVQSGKYNVPADVVARAIIDAHSQE